MACYKEGEKITDHTVSIERHPDILHMNKNLKLTSKSHHSTEGVLPMLIPWPNDILNRRWSNFREPIRSPSFQPYNTDRKHQGTKWNSNIVITLWPITCPTCSSRWKLQNWLHVTPETVPSVSWHVLHHIYSLEQEREARTFRELDLRNIHSLIHIWNGKKKKIHAIWPS